MKCVLYLILEQNVLSKAISSVSIYLNNNFIYINFRNCRMKSVRCSNSAISSSRRSPIFVPGCQLLIQRTPRRPPPRWRPPTVITTCITMGWHPVAVFQGPPTDTFRIKVEPPTGNQGPELGGGRLRSSRNARRRLASMEVSQ